MIMALIRIIWDIVAIAILFVSVIYLVYLALLAASSGSLY